MGLILITLYDMTVTPKFMDRTLSKKLTEEENATPKTIGKVLWKKFPKMDGSIRELLSHTLCGEKYHTKLLTFRKDGRRLNIDQFAQRFRQIAGLP